MRELIVVAIVAVAILGFFIAKLKTPNSERAKKYPDYPARTK